VGQIILITAANQQKGEPNKLSTLGFRPAQWCQENLELEGSPMPLRARIELKGNENVFAKVDQDEKGPLEPGLYRSNRIPTEIKEVLRDATGLSHRRRCNLLP
jgi:hypothetical protein